jgi:hypothetical protein
MAEYLPPTETLPKFNEFVFDDAYSIEGVDRRAVHKAGTETITGQKTFTGNFYINNLITSILSATSFTVTSAINFLNGNQNRIASNLVLSSNSIGNKIDCQGGYNLMTSATTSSIANQIEATGGASNSMTTLGAGNNVLNAQGTGNNSIISQTGNNELTAGTANKMIIGSTEKLAITSNLTTLTNVANTITSTTGNNTITTTGTSGSNFLTATGVSSNSVTNFLEVLNGNGGNILRAIATGTGNGGYNSIIGRNNYYDALVQHYLRIGASGSEVNKIQVDGATTTLTNTTINVNGTTNVNGYLTNTSAGGGGFTMVGSGTGGLYTNYYPDGTGAGRKAYLGFPNTGSHQFSIYNEYTDGTMLLRAVNNIEFTTSQIRKDGFDYPNIQIQWQSNSFSNSLNTWFEMSNSWAGTDITQGETNYVKFPFQVRVNYVFISFSASSFGGFNNRELQLRFITSAGTVYSVGSTGAILGNVDRAQYITSNVNLPANTELRPQFAYQGVLSSGTVDGKAFSANFNFTQFV